MDDLNMQQFGARLREQREARDWTLAELQTRTGIDIPTLSRLENAGATVTVRPKRTATLHSLYRLCQALNISSDYLLGLSGEKQRKKHKRTGG